MVPSAFVFLDSLPLTANGKINRKALPAPSQIKREFDGSFRAPRNEVEETLARIWEEVLGLERISVRDSFFDLGGNSLSAVNVHSRMREELQIQLPIRYLFQFPTIESIALPIEDEQRQRYSSGARTGTDWKYLREFQAGKGRSPVYMVPGGIGGEVDVEFFFYARLAHFIGADYPIYGLRPRGAAGDEEPHWSVRQMAKDYLNEIRSFQARGPYYLTGACLGGAVAYEMAYQLETIGEKVAFLGLLDTVCPRVQDYVKYRRLQWIEQYHSTKQRWTENYYAKRLGHHWRAVRRLSWRDRAGYLHGRSVAALSDLNQAYWSESHASQETAAETSLPPISAEVKAFQQAYERALRRYRPRPYRGKLTLLNAEAVFSEFGEAGGWERRVAGTIEEHILPGNHLTLFRQDVKILAGRIRSCLEQATTEAHR
jgi:thioesterase domain-containing protein/acyl carrier protein